MKPIIIKSDSEGRLLITEEEISKIVDDAYNAGYADGIKSAKHDESITWPSYPKTLPVTYDTGSPVWRDYLTCKSDIYNVSAE